MPETAQRRLVKSPPELWSEISDAQSLARRLSALGEVRITRIEPETAVAWEGASIRGTVELEASGWGTKVTLTAERERPEPEQTPEAAALAAQDTQQFDSSALARLATRAAEPAADETCPEPEATGTDIPPQASGPPPREDRFLARLKGWWNTGRRPARQPDPAPGTKPAAAETPAIRAELQPPRAEADLVPERIAAPEVEPEVRAEPPAPAPARDPELEGLLVQILDDLGSAHHRPFSRA